MKDLAQFFIDLMRNQQLGKIANAHLAFASTEDKRAASPQVESLQRSLFFDLWSFAVSCPCKVAF
jgi:hypothetical protein